MSWWERAGLGQRNRSSGSAGHRMMRRWRTKHHLLDLLLPTSPVSDGSVSLKEGCAGKLMLPCQPVSTARADPGETGLFTEPTRVFRAQGDEGFLVPKHPGSPPHSCSLY